MSYISNMFHRSAVHFEQAIDEITNRSQWVLGTGQPVHAEPYWNGRVYMFEDRQWYQSIATPRNSQQPRDAQTYHFDKVKGTRYAWIPNRKRDTAFTHAVEHYEPDFVQGTYSLVGPRVSQPRYAPHRSALHLHRCPTERLLDVTPDIEELAELLRDNAWLPGVVFYTEDKQHTCKVTRNELNHLMGASLRQANGS